MKILKTANYKKIAADIEDTDKSFHEKFDSAPWWLFLPVFQIESPNVPYLCQNTPLFLKYYSV